jgi:hypothetical protein
MKGNYIEINRLPSSWRPLQKAEDSTHRIYYGESITLCRGLYCEVRISRWRDKGGVDDLRKIKQFCDFIIESELEKLDKVKL